jgi:hypothetical protein
VGPTDFNIALVRVMLPVWSRKHRVGEYFMFRINFRRGMSLSFFPTSPCFIHHHHQARKKKESKTGATGIRPVSTLFAEFQEQFTNTGHY